MGVKMSFNCSNKKWSGHLQEQRVEKPQEPETPAASVSAKTGYAVSDSSLWRLVA